MTPDPLHLPATIPGLLRRGSPVARGNGRGTVTHLSKHGWVIVHDDPLLYDHDGPGFSGGSGDVRHCGWALDLHDATGRHHAALWLAENAGLPSAHTGLSWGSWPTRMCPEMVGYVGWLSVPVDQARGPRPPEDAFFGAPRPDDAWLHRAKRYIDVPTLADLDPTSDERLADGSRRVDALALARVVAHVAGEVRDA